MTEVGLRDRWVMTGLVVLGLLTVLAGVPSGRSTIDYVLSRDAREAALAWSAEIDQRLRSPRGETTAEVADDDIQSLNATALDEMIADSQEPVMIPQAPSFRTDGFSLIDGFNWLNGGWLLSDIDQKQHEFVSRMDGFAIVSSIVGLGQSFHVTITAEGVETEGQAAMLKKWGCDQVQGYYYGRPEAEVSEDEAADAPLGTRSSDDAGSTPREDNPLRRPLVA